MTKGTGFAANKVGRPVAGKTGTTNDNLSAWFAGYSPDLAAAVMFVKEDDKGIPVTLRGTGGLKTVTGGSFPARIWTAFMKAALKDVPVSKFVAPAIPLPVDTTTVVTETVTAGDPATVGDAAGPIS